jgi:CMP-N-acetylneuraminic acid synthetase
MFSEGSKAYVLPPHRVRDLDTEEDWLVAQALWQARAKEQSSTT